MVLARVLILDDEPLIAMLLQDWLEELGYKPVGPASTVAQAVGIIESDSLDAAILDVSLQKTDCYPVADALKARGIPFTFGTGHFAQAIVPRHADVPVLCKPYDLNALQEMMSKLLERFSDA